MDDAESGCSSLFQLPLYVWFEVFATGLKRGVRYHFLIIINEALQMFQMIELWSMEIIEEYYELENLLMIYDLQDGPPGK